jgi:hypothetical protein
MITAGERWKLFVLHHEAVGKRGANAILAQKNFREYLDSLVDPASKQTADAKVSGDIAAILAKR